MKTLPGSSFAVCGLRCNRSKLELLKTPEYEKFTCTVPSCKIHFWLDSGYLKNRMLNFTEIGNIDFANDNKFLCTPAISAHKDLCFYPIRTLCNQWSFNLKVKWETWEINYRPFNTTRPDSLGLKYSIVVCWLVISLIHK